MWQGECSLSLVSTATVNVVDPLGKKRRLFLHTDTLTSAAQSKTVHNYIWECCSMGAEFICTCRDYKTDGLYMLD